MPSVMKSKRRAVADCPPQAQDVAELNSVLLVSYNYGLSEADVRACLENRSESGGGPVDSVQNLNCTTWVVRFNTHQDAVNAVSRQMHEVDTKYKGRQPLFVFLYDEQSGSIYSGHDALHWERGGEKRTADIPRVDPQAPDTVLVTSIPLGFGFTAHSIKADIERLGTGTRAVKSVRYVKDLRLAFVVFNDPNGARTVAEKGTCELTDSDSYKWTSRVFLYRGTLSQHDDVTQTASTPGVQQARAPRQGLIQQAVEAMETSDTPPDTPSDTPCIADTESNKPMTAATPSHTPSTPPGPLPGNILATQRAALEPAVQEARETADKSGTPAGLRAQTGQQVHQTDALMEAEARLEKKYQAALEQAKQQMEAERELEVAARLQAEREHLEHRLREELERRLEENMERRLQDLGNQLEARLLTERRDLQSQLLSQVKTEMEVFLRAEIRQPLAQVMNHVTQLQNGFTQIQEQVTHVQKQVTRVQEQVRETENQVTETENQVSKLGAQTSQLKRDIDQTRSDLKAEVEHKVERDVTQLKHHVTGLQTELENRLRGEMGEATRELRSEVMDLVNRLREVAGQTTSELRSEAMDLENQTTQTMEQLEQRVMQLQTSLDTQDRLHVGLIGEVGRQARNEVTNLMDRIQGLGVQVHDMHERLNHLARAACGPHHLFVDNQSDET